MPTKYNNVQPKWERKEETFYHLTSKIGQIINKLEHNISKNSKLKLEDYTIRV